MPYPASVDAGLLLPYVDVRSYGAVLNEVKDDTAAIQSAINATSALYSGGTVFIPGIAAVSGSITVPGNVAVIGSGQNSGVKILASFSGAQVFLLNGDFAQVRDMQIAGPTSTFSSNPAADAVLISGAR